MADFSFDSLVGSIREVDSQFVLSAVKAVNISLTLRNWCVGAYIKEFELHGADRAGTGRSCLTGFLCRCRLQGCGAVISGHFPGMCSFMSGIRRSWVCFRVRLGTSIFRSAEIWNTREIL